MNRGSSSKSFGIDILSDETSSSTVCDYGAELTDEDLKRQLSSCENKSLYNDPRRNTAINKLWRRQMWEYQERELEVFKKLQQQEKELESLRKLCQQQFKNQNDLLDTENDTPTETVKSLASAFAVLTKNNPTSTGALNIMPVLPFSLKTKNTGNNAAIKEKDCLQEKVTIAKQSPITLEQPINKTLQLNNSESKNVASKISTVEIIPTSDIIVYNSQPIFQANTNLLYFNEGASKVKQDINIQLQPPSKPLTPRALRLTFKDQPKKYE